MNNEAFVTALNKLANAFAELAEALSVDAPAEEAAKPAKAAKPAAADKPAKATKPEPTKPEPAKIEYTEIAAAIGKLVTTKGRNRAIDVLADYGAKTGKDLKANQYAAFLKTVATETADA